VELFANSLNPESVKYRVYKDKFNWRYFSIARMPITHTDLLLATTVIVHGSRAMFIYVLWTSLSVLFFLEKNGKKCASGRDKCLLSRTSQKSSIKSSTLSLANSLDRFRP